MRSTYCTCIKWPPSSKFTFEGFLPKKGIDREKILLEISKNEKTTIVFESPHRLKNLLNELKEYIGSKREIRVARELTKKFEEHIGNDIDDVLNFFKDKEVVGEITLVIQGKNKKSQNTEIDNTELKKELYSLINAGCNLSGASKYLAKKNNLPKRLIYNMYNNQIDSN